MNVALVLLISILSVLLGLVTFVQLLYLESLRLRTRDLPAIKFFRETLEDKIGFETEGGAGESGGEGVQDARRENVGFLRAGHLAAQGHGRSEQRIGLRDYAIAIVDGVGAGKSIAVAQDVIRAQRAEVFLNALSGIVKRFRGAAGRRLSWDKQLRAIG